MPGVARPRAVTVAEKVDEDYAIPTGGECISKSVMVCPRKKQSMDENDGSRARTTFLECDPKAVVVKGAHFEASPFVVTRASSSRFNTLPVPVRGSSSRTSILRGTL